MLHRWQFYCFMSDILTERGERHYPPVKPRTEENNAGTFESARKMNLLHRCETNTFSVTLFQTPRHLNFPFWSFPNRLWVGRGRSPYVLSRLCAGVPMFVCFVFLVFLKSVFSMFAWTALQPRSVNARPPQESLLFCHVQQKLDRGALQMNK